MSGEPSIAVVLGATATGKSRLALALAERLGGEIVNADALQVYRGLDIGTAKPTAEERERVAHHLVDILDPRERYSAGEFARRARRAIAEIRGRGRWPFVVGGSGLYQRALLQGMRPMPPVPAALRRHLRRRAEEEGLGPLVRELSVLDPEASRRLAAADRQRTLRALEVALASGRRWSDLTAERPFRRGSLPAVRLGLTLPRAILYDRIAERVVRMIDAGWIDEVAALLDRGVDPSAPAFQAIGYRPWARYLRGQWSFERALRETTKATRRFAKRQETWFRREPDVLWLDASRSSDLVEKALRHLLRSGSGRGHVET